MLNSYPAGSAAGWLIKIDRILYWTGVVLVAIGIPNLLDVPLLHVPAYILVGSNPKIQRDLIAALFFVIIGGILFVSKKRKLKILVTEEKYKNAN